MGREQRHTEDQSRSLRTISFARVAKGDYNEGVAEKVEFIEYSNQLDGVIKLDRLFWIRAQCGESTVLFTMFPPSPKFAVEGSGIFRCRVFFGRGSARSVAIREAVV
jgi:hypothetical protein